MGRYQNDEISTYSESQGQDRDIAQANRFIHLVPSFNHKREEKIEIKILAKVVTHMLKYDRFVFVAPFQFQALFSTPSGFDALEWYTSITVSRFSNE